MDAATAAAIERAAAETGIDPAYMKAVAERESSFNPNAHASKTIYGMYQMTGPIRRQYGMGDSQDPYQQSKAFGLYTNDLRKDMGARLGRQPSYAETYTGHHFGPGRAASMLKDPDGQTSVADAFTPYELSLNPHIVRAGTTGALRDSTVGDMTRRMSKYGGSDSGSGPASSGPGGPSEPFSFASYGEPVDEGEPSQQPSAAAPKSSALPSSARRGTGAQGFAAYGEPIDEGAPQSAQSGTSQDFSKDIAQIAKNYPALAPHMKNLVVQNGKSSGPGDDRKLEFYQPWDKDNPNPGKLTSEIFSPMQGTDLQETIAGDMLHHLGAVDPSTGKPVDQKWYDLKQQLGAARQPFHLKADQEAYGREKANPSYGTDPYPQWDQNNRLDAYARAGVFPKQNPEWNNPEEAGDRAFMDEPAMKPIIGRMKDYLSGGSEQPKKMGLGYDQNLDEMGSGYDPASAAAAQKADQGIVKSPSIPNSADASMEKDPAKVPKQPLSQVPQEELDDNRPDFYQRQFQAYGEPVEEGLQT